MSRTKKASADIKPNRIVIQHATQDGYVTQATAATAKLYGISDSGTRRVPLAGLDDGLRAKAEENIVIFCDPGEMCLLYIGSGGCAPGDKLTSGSDGEGIATITNLQEVVAVAEQTAAQYGYAWVKINKHQISLA